MFFLNKYSACPFTYLPFIATSDVDNVVTLVQRSIFIYEQEFQCFVNHIFSIEKKISLSLCKDSP